MSEPYSAMYLYEGPSNQGSISSSLPAFAPTFSLNFKISMVD